MFDGIFYQGLFFDFPGRKILKSAGFGIVKPNFNAFFRGQAAIHFMQFIQRMSRTLRTLDIVTFIGQILSQRRQEIQLSGSLRMEKIRKNENRLFDAP